MPHSHSKASLDRREQDRALFNRISEAYNRKDLHPASLPARRQRLLQTVRDVEMTADSRLLEVGCGAGFSADYLAARYGFFQGIDHSQELVRLGRERWEQKRGHERVRFDMIDALQFEAPERFHGIFMVGVLHHIDKERAVLIHLQEALLPGGWIAINEPSSQNWVLQFLRGWRKRFDKSYSDDQRTYRIEELEALFSAAGYEEIKIRAQGIFSTPFAEVPLDPTWLTKPLALGACWLDRVLERLFPRLLRRLSWNLVLTARSPHTAHDSAK